jgi:hypothetical protein
MKKIIIFLTTVLLVSCGKENSNDPFINALSEITAKTIANSKVGGGSTIRSSNERGKGTIIKDYVISDNDKYVYTQVTFSDLNNVKRHKFINQYKKKDLISALVLGVEKAKRGHKVKFISYDGETLVFEIKGQSDEPGCELNVQIEVSAGNHYRLNNNKTYARDCNGDFKDSVSRKQFVSTFDITNGETLSEIELRADNNYGVYEFKNGQLKRSVLSEETKFDLNFDGKIGY